MKSIAFRIGYLLIVLVVDVSSIDYPFLNGAKKTQNSLYNFGYNAALNSFLIMEITLKNLPPSVTTVTATQFTWDYGSDHQTQKGEVNIDKEKREGKFMILSSLIHTQIWVDVQLYNKGTLCDETRITEGRYTYLNNELASFYWDTTQRTFVYYYYNNWIHDATGSCFAPNACEIILDLTDTCKAKLKSTSGDKVECHIEESQYICTFLRAETNYEDLKLCQTNEDNIVIGPLLEINQQRTKLSFKLELELFDNNTSVKLGLMKTNNRIWSHTLSITAKDISKASYNVTILNYTDTTHVRFSCEQYKNQYTTTKVHVGFINTTDHKIITHNTTIMRKSKFTMVDNGTILCCIVYQYEEGSQEITATRFVENKTLLVYQSHEPTSTNLIAVSNEQGNAACQVKWWLYLLLTLLGIAVLLLTIYIVLKQRCCTNSQPAEETVELNNYDTTNQVLYANLDIVHNESRPNHQTEESPYANIVGVLHPL